MTIKDYIITAELKIYTDRLNKLVEMTAPSAVIQRQHELIKEIRDGKIAINGSKECLDIDYTDHEVKTGKGGKPYVSFNKGTINYFPQAKFGRCIYYSQAT